MAIGEIIANGKSYKPKYRIGFLGTCKLPFWKRIKLLLCKNLTYSIGVYLDGDNVKVLSVQGAGWAEPHDTADKDETLWFYPDTVKLEE